MAKSTYSHEDFFGDIHHFDEKGHEIGVSRRNFLGGYTDYDAKGKVTGHTEESIFGDELTHYDTKGHVIGRSQEQLFGDYTEYDANGHISGTRHRSVLDADYRRLESSNSVYRRSFDPPPFLDPLSDMSDENDPAHASSAIPAYRSKPSNTARDSGRQEGGSLLSYSLMSVLFMCFVLFLATHC